MELKCPNAFLKSLKKSRIYCTSYKSGDSLKLFSFESSLSFAYSYTVLYLKKENIPSPLKIYSSKGIFVWRNSAQNPFDSVFQMPPPNSVQNWETEHFYYFMFLVSDNRNYLIDSLKMQIILKEENINHSSVICWEMCVFPDRWQEIGNLELKWFQ